MKKFLMRSRISNSIPVVIKSLRGTPTTVTVSPKGTEIWDYQFTNDIQIKQHNGILELKLIEDYTNKENTEVGAVKATQPNVEKPKEVVKKDAPKQVFIQQTEAIKEEKRSKRGRPTSRVIDKT